MIDLVTSARTPYSVAKTLALRGLAVFPVRSRQPLTARGFYSATSDIHALPQLNWADADGVGIPTGLMLMFGLVHQGTGKNPLMMIWVGVGMASLH
jgi:hypothetical protein